MVALTLATLLASCGGAAQRTRPSLGQKLAEDAARAQAVGQHHAAIQGYERALAHFRSTDDRKQIARSTHNQAVSLMALGLHREATGRLMESAALHEALADDGGLAHDLLALGECLAYLDEPAEARAVLERAAQVGGRANEPGVQARAWSSVGVLDVRAGKLDSAEAAYASAAKAAAKTPAEGTSALVAHNQGRLDARRGSTARAEQRLRSAVAGYRKAKDTDGLSTALSDLAELVAGSGGRDAEAAELWLRAGWASTSIGRATRAERAFLLAARAYDAAGKPDRAASARDRADRVRARAGLPPR